MAGVNTKSIIKPRFSLKLLSDWPMLEQARTSTSMGTWRARAVDPLSLAARVLLRAVDRPPLGVVGRGVGLHGEVAALEHLGQEGRDRAELRLRDEITIAFFLNGDSMTQKLFSIAE